jgi:coniferyl-aldehyde dehydrogenase
MPAEEENFLQRTTSGGACVNDVMFHMLQKDLPFGGVGPSGMGAYHGIEGFKTFSHAKSVYKANPVLQCFEARWFLTTLWRRRRESD